MPSDQRLSASVGSNFSASSFSDTRASSVYFEDVQKMYVAPHQLLSISCSMVVSETDFGDWF